TRAPGVNLVVVWYLFARRDDFSAARGAANLGPILAAPRHTSIPPNRLIRSPICVKAAPFYYCLHCALRRFPHNPKRQRLDGFAGPTVPALTLGAMWQPRNTANSFRLGKAALWAKASACGGL